MERDGRLIHSKTAEMASVLITQVLQQDIRGMKQRSEPGEGTEDPCYECNLDGINIKFTTTSDSIIVVIVR
jgi:hypothetical protein